VKKWPTFEKRVVNGYLEGALSPDLSTKRPTSEMDVIAFPGFETGFIL
jgi:hypothetical protein